MLNYAHVFWQKTEEQNPVHPKELLLPILPYNILN